MEEKKQRERNLSRALWGFNSRCIAKQGWAGILRRRGIQWDPSRHGVSSVSTVMHELPGHVPRPSAFQAAANGTFKNGGYASVAPIKMLEWGWWGIARHYLKPVLRGRTAEQLVTGDCVVTVVFIFLCHFEPKSKHILKLTKFGTHYPEKDT